MIMWLKQYHHTKMILNSEKLYVHKPHYHKPLTRSYQSKRRKRDSVCILVLGGTWYRSFPSANYLNTMAQWVDNFFPTIKKPLSYDSCIGVIRGRPHFCGRGDCKVHFYFVPSYTPSLQTIFSKWTLTPGVANKDERSSVKISSVHTGRYTGTDHIWISNQLLASHWLFPTLTIMTVEYLIKSSFPHPD
jgi:hypothetical protein